MALGFAAGEMCTDENSLLYAVDENFTLVILYSFKNDYLMSCPLQQPSETKRTCHLFFCLEKLLLYFVITSPQQNMREKF